MAPTQFRLVNPSETELKWDKGKSCLERLQGQTLEPLTLEPLKSEFCFERASPRQIWELGGLRPFWTAHRGCGTPSRSSRRYPGARLGLPDPNHSIQSTPRLGLTLGTYGVSAGPRRAPRCHRSIGPEEEFSYGVRMAQIGAGLRQGPQPGDADTPFRNNKPSTLTDSGGDCRWYRTSRREARHRRLCAPVRALFTHRHAMTPFSPGHCAHFERGAGSYT